MVGPVDLSSTQRATVVSCVSLMSLLMVCPRLEGELPGLLEYLLSGVAREEIRSSCQLNICVSTILCNVDHISTHRMTVITSDDAEDHEVIA